MHNRTNYISVYEHQDLKVGQKYCGVEFSDAILESLQMFYGNGVPYYTLTHKGVKFREYVGVLQVGNTIIEILPKADREDDKKKWRNILIGMLQVVGAFKLSAPTNSTLSLKHNSVLDLYFNLFISEVEYLVQRGLVKQYRKRESNCKVLKGRLNFGKHIQKNLIHKEMLYVNHTTYDVEHRLHMILYKTIRLLKQINTNPMLNNRLGQLILNLPEMPDIYVSESVFDKLKYSRKTEIYRKAVDIAKLLLLNYHPDIKKGTNNVLALMFDMNVLWERFVYSSLYKNRGSYTVESQISKDFWLSNTRGIIKMRPDIVIRDRDKSCIVFDTKWKVVDAKPSVEDLRQLYAYKKLYKAERVALVYPGEESMINCGHFCDSETQINTGGIIKLGFANNNISDIQKYISEFVIDKFMSMVLS